MFNCSRQRLAAIQRAIHNLEEGAESCVLRIGASVREIDYDGLDELYRLEDMVKINLHKQEVQERVSRLNESLLDELPPKGSSREEPSLYRSH